MKSEDLLKLKEEIQADLAAVNQLLSRPAREKKLVALIETHSPPKNSYQAAEDIIKNMNRNFTVLDICFELRKLGKKTGPHTSPVVSQVINKLRQRNPSEIEVVEAGRGSRSGSYRYKKPNS